MERLEGSSGGGTGRRQSQHPPPDMQVVDIDVERPIQSVSEQQQQPSQSKLPIIVVHPDGTSVDFAVEGR